MARWPVGGLTLLAGCHVIFPLSGAGEDGRPRSDAGSTDAAGDGGGDAEDATPGADGGGCAVGCDADEDGFCAERCGGSDCDDADSRVRPDAIEIEEWTLEVVGTGAADPALAVRDDRVWVAWYDESRLLAARREAPNDWAEAEIVAWVVGSLSIATDAQGEAHLAFHASATSDLWYAYRGDGAWIVERVSAADPDPGDWAGRNCSLALDSTGSPRIAYGSREQSVSSLVHSTRDGDGEPRWAHEVVEDDATNVSPSLAIDPDDVSRILFRSGAGTLALTAGPEWATTWLGPISSRFAPLALAPDGEPHFAFSATDEVRHGVLVDGEPEYDAITGSEGGVSIAVGADGRPRAVVVPEDGSVQFSTRTNDVWDGLELVAGAGGRGAQGQPTLAVASGRLHVAWLANDGQVVYAFRSVADAVDNDCDDRVR